MGVVSSGKRRVSGDPDTIRVNSRFWPAEAVALGEEDGKGWLSETKKKTLGGKRGQGIIRGIMRVV